MPESSDSGAARMFRELTEGVAALPKPRPASEVATVHTSQLLALIKDAARHGLPDLPILIYERQGETVFRTGRIVWANWGRDRECPVFMLELVEDSAHPNERREGGTGGAGV